MWADGWVGIPHREIGRSAEGYDCLGLFIALQRARFGREIYDPMCSMSVAVRRNIVVRQQQSWRVVTEGREGDAALFKVRGLSLHVGFVLDARRMLHSCGEIGESVIEDYRGMGWGQRLEGIYRYVG